MNLLDLVSPFRKAIVAALATALLTLLAANGASGDMTVNEAVQAASSAVVSGVLTYLVPNRK